jgi:hypothetical protein
MCREARALGSLRYRRIALVLHIHSSIPKRITGDGPTLEAPSRFIGNRSVIDRVLIVARDDGRIPVARPPPPEPVLARWPPQVAHRCRHVAKEGSGDEASNLPMSLGHHGR